MRQLTTTILALALLGLANHAGTGLSRQRVIGLFRF